MRFVTAYNTKLQSNNYLLIQDQTNAYALFVTRKPSKASPPLALRPPRLAPLGDGPPRFTEGHEDRFDLSLRVGAVYDILRHKDTPTPLSIAIYGDWGSGKTTAMRWLEANLQDWNEQSREKGKLTVLPVWFAPWKYQDQEDVWRGLIGQVIVACLTKEDDVQTLYEDMKDFAVFLGRSFVSLLSGLKFTAGISQDIKAQFDGERIRELQGHVEAYFNPQNAYTNQFEHALNQWVDRHAGQKGERIVVFIDDLDRCMPEISLKVLEALKLYLDIPGLIFVVGVDRQVVDQLVQGHYERYGLSPDKSRYYLAKMFPVEVEVGPTDIQVEAYLGTLLSNNKQWNELSSKEQEIFQNVINHLADRSPREVRRLVDSALIRGAGARLYAEEKGSAATLTVAQGIQVYLTERVLAQPEHNRASLVRQQRGNLFFKSWSEIASADVERASASLPADLVRRLTAVEDSEHAKEASIGTTSMRRQPPERVLQDVPDAYRELVADPTFHPLLELLADAQLGQLLRLPWPEEAVALSQGSEPRSELAQIREAMARSLGISVEVLPTHDPKKIARLDLKGAEISDLSPLQGLTGLSVLIISGTPVSDLLPLQGLIGLSALYLSGTPVSDLSPLQDLDGLLELDLKGTQVSDLSPLQDLAGLHWLDLQGTEVRDLSPLQGLTGLEVVNLQGTQVSDLSPLQGLKSLKIVKISASNITRDELDRFRVVHPKTTIIIDD